MLQESLFNDVLESLLARQVLLRESHLGYHDYLDILLDQRVELDDLRRDYGVYDLDTRRYMLRWDEEHDLREQENLLMNVIERAFADEGVTYQERFMARYNKIHEEVYDVLHASLTDTTYVMLCRWQMRATTLYHRYQGLVDNDRLESVMNLRREIRDVTDVLAPSEESVSEGAVIDITTWDGHLPSVPTTPIAEITMQADRDAHQRVCERCGGDVYTYINGQFLCFTCADAGPESRYFRETYVRQSLNQGHHIQVQGRTLLGLYLEVNQCLQERYQIYLDMPDLIVKRDDQEIITWRNPFSDGPSRVLQLIQSIANQLQLGEDCSVIQDQEQELVDIFVARESICAGGACGCNLTDPLLLIFCSVCLREFESRGVVFTSVGDYRDVHGEIQESIITRNEFNLPTGWDEMNMLAGRDDHGDLVNLGASTQWIVGAIEVCSICGDEVLLYMCDGHGCCLECIVSWESTSVGTCPFCRRLKHR